MDDVRREITRFVSGEIDLWALDDWLNARTLNLPKADSAFLLSREVFLQFAEVTSGHRSEEEARERLRSMTVERSDADQRIASSRLAG